MNFTREDWTLFRTLGTLGQKAGVPVEHLPRLVLKELVDNALDASGHCEFGLSDDGVLWVQDAGPGLEGDDAALASLFSVARPLASSKLLRLPLRGALGNGLRVVAGAVLASGGTLQVSTRGRTLHLRPLDNGTTDFTLVGPFEKAGTRLEVTLGGTLQPHLQNALWWAKRSMMMLGGTTYRGRTSPYWYDSDSFYELLQAAGDTPIESLLGSFEGIPRRVAADIADEFGVQSAVTLTRTDADELLVDLRGACEPVREARLGFVGKQPHLGDGYARKTGTFTMPAARGSLSAQIPFVVEVWARVREKPLLWLHTNRTAVTAELDAFHKKNDLHVFGCGLSHRIPMGRRPMALIVNLQTPYVPITTDGKEPNLRPFLGAIADCMTRAARLARRWQQRAEVGDAREKDLIIDCLYDAVQKASGDGRYRFSQRQLYYAVRPYVISALQKEPNYDYFARVLTEYEAVCGAIPGMYRDPRGILYHPHLGHEIPLGTIAVERYSRPDWTFNKILYSEKEGFFSILRSVGWPERHDCALLTSKGFASRAARDVLDLLGEGDEELLFFCIHDADAHGTMIYQALQDGTLARPGRKVRIINLGLEPEEALTMGLEIEKVERKKPAPVADYVPDEWRDWLQHSRVELNAMSTPLFLRWLDAKFAAYGQGKLVPPAPVLGATFEQDVQSQVRRRLTDRILTEARLDEQVEKAIESLRPRVHARQMALDFYVREELANEPRQAWKKPLSQLAASVVDEELI